MALQSGFFMSVNGDRKYKADFFAKYFASFIGNGVFPNPSTNLQVLANSDMTVTVKAGKAWINGYILFNDDDYILNIDVADGVLSRIDRVVLRYDTADREIRVEVKKGIFASSPVTPELQRDADAYELVLADIKVNKGAISITQTDITDLRLNTELCGIVHGVVDQVDTTTLFSQYASWYEQTTGQAEVDMNNIKNQFMSDFNNWFLTVKDILDENVAGNLLNLIIQTQDELNIHLLEYEAYKLNASKDIRQDVNTKLRTEVTNSLPLSGDIGQIIFDQEQGKFKGYDGGKWV